MDKTNCSSLARRYRWKNERSKRFLKSIYC